MKMAHEKRMLRNLRLGSRMDKAEQILFPIEIPGSANANKALAQKFHFT